MTHHEGPCVPDVSQQGREAPAQLRANGPIRPLTCENVVEPVTGIEPACPAWESKEPPRKWAPRARTVAHYCPLPTFTCRHLWLASGPRASHNPLEKHCPKRVLRPNARGAWHRV